MSATASQMFTCMTEAGCTRLEGFVVLAIAWWIHDGGLQDVETIADSVNFEELEKKIDWSVGRLVLEKKDYTKPFVEDLRKNPTMYFMFGLVSKEFELKTFENFVEHRLAVAIGHHLFGNGWWKDNEKRIKMQRENFKSVKKVMES